MRLTGHAGSGIWVVAILSGLFLSLMVSCGGQGCSWERATDTRGLNRHRASCRFYKKSSILATRKRQEHAKEAVSAHLAHDLSVNTITVSGPSTSNEVILQSCELEL